MGRNFLQKKFFVEEIFAEEIYSVEGFLLNFAEQIFCVSRE